MRTRLILICMVLAVLTTIAWGGRKVVLSRLRAHNLLRLAPDLDPQLAIRVVSSSDTEWLAYCRRVGIGHLGDALQTLGFELRRPTYTEFLERRRPLENAALRIAEGFTHVFAFPLPEQSFRHYMAMPPERDFHLRQLERRYIEVAADTRLSPDERIRIVDELVVEFLANGDPNRAILASLVATRDELEAGRPDRHRARLSAGLRMARKYGQVYAVCQKLGELGSIYAGAGDEDSLRICLDEGIALALRHGLLDHAARMLKFYAVFHAHQGRLALALDELGEAQRLCERPGGDSARLRFQVEYTKFVAGLGCWDLVDRSLRRLPPLLREFPRAGREGEARKHAFDAGRLRARLAFATGHPDQGSLLMRNLSQSVPAVHRRVGFAELFDEWSAGLEVADRRAEALEICDVGIVHCDTAHVPEHQVPLLLRRARVLEALDRTPESMRGLADLDSLVASWSKRDESVDREIGVLRARLLFRQGRPAEAKRTIQRAFEDFRRTLGQGNGGPLSYLELDEAVSLRDAVHEIERFTPEQGYAFEMDWRALARHGTAAHMTIRSGSDFRSARPPPRALDGPHLVYRFTGNVLLRWTATSGSVVLDTLSMSATQCLEKVQEALRLLQSESPPLGQFLGPKALRSLQPLSAALLPRSLSTAVNPHHRLYVSADGPLVALPFEALPVSNGRGGEPLTLTTDITYVRGSGARVSTKSGPAVIVSNPSLSPELMRRNGWEAGLLGSADESQAALARWPDAVVLSGDRATREAVTRSWQGASIIYFAAHHVRDADTPFLGYVPLAAPPGRTASNASFLEIADVYSMDLSSCRLAVLASCASGAPYRMALRPGVSLSDAVLDSGADAVVQSFWDVGDLETREFMKAFLATWREDDNDAVALNHARRSIMTTPQGAAPRVWAAWTVLATMPDGSHIESSPLHPEARPIHKPR